MLDDDFKKLSLGHQPDGTYLAPCKLTVLISKDAPFAQRAIAHLYIRAIESSQLVEGCENIEYITPTILILDHTLLLAWDNSKIDIESFNNILVLSNEHNCAFVFKPSSTQEVIQLKPYDLFAEVNDGFAAITTLLYLTYYPDVETIAADRELVWFMNKGARIDTLISDIHNPDSMDNYIDYWTNAITRQKYYSDYIQTMVNYATGAIRAECMALINYIAREDTTFVVGGDVLYITTNNSYSTSDLFTVDELTEYMCKHLLKVLYKTCHLIEEPEIKKITLVAKPREKLD